MDKIADAGRAGGRGAALIPFGSQIPEDLKVAGTKPTMSSTDKLSLLRKAERFHDLGLFAAEAMVNIDLGAKPKSAYKKASKQFKNAGKPDDEADMLVKSGVRSERAYGKAARKFEKKELFLDAFKMRVNMGESEDDACMREATLCEKSGNLYLAKFLRRHAEELREKIASQQLDTASDCMVKTT